MDRYPKILLVEDDPIVLLTLTLELQAAGFEVLGTADPREARAALLAAPGVVAAAVIGLDALADGDPFAVTGAARALNPALAVVYTAASFRPALHAQGIGDDDLLIKPFPPRALAQTVRMAIERRAGL